MTTPALCALDGLTAADAEWLDAEAAAKRAAAECGVGPVWKAQQHAEADGIEALAAALRDPAGRGVLELRFGHGGETAALAHSDMPGTFRELVQAVQSKPTMLAAEATLERLHLARGAGVLTLAVEAAESVGANGAVQQMLTHEMAAAHKLTMRLMAAADGELNRHVQGRAMGSAPDALADATRSATAAGRLMDSVTRAALALDRLLNGSRQQVVVQHVVVADGGQAVVAGGGVATTRRGGGCQD